MRYDAKRGFWEQHTPGAKLNYGIEYAEYLDSGDSISESTWTADAGVTLTNQSVAGTVTTVFAEGGVAGQHYQLKNRIVTSNGLIDIHTILLVCE